MEVLPLTVVNLLQRVESTNMMPEPTTFWHHSPPGDKCDRIAAQEHADAAISSDTDSGTECSEYGEVFVDLVKQYESEDEFGGDELAKLIEAEGPPEILQLILQGQADDFMKEEVTDGDDYADWIRWVADEEQSMREERATKCTAELASQQHRTLNTALVPTLLPVGTVGSSESEHPSDTRLHPSSHKSGDARWNDISQRIKVDSNLEKGRQQQLWAMLEQYQDVFAWNKGELGYCTVGEHVIDTQGFPPCRVAPGRLLYWEEAEVKRQIDALVELGKMKPSNSEYACRVTLPVKKDGSRHFCGDYRPLNAQIRRDSFPMPLVEDVID